MSGLLLVGLLAGCSPGPAPQRAQAGPVLDSLSESLNQASSAVATGRLVTDQRASGKLPPVTADVALADAIQAADDAAHELSTIVVPAGQLAALRDQALRATQQGVFALTQQRTDLADVSNGARGSDQLTKAARALSDAADRAEAAQEAE